MQPALLAQGPADLSHLARHMTDLMHKVLQSGFCGGARVPDWTPAVDICESEDRYEVIVELAGVRREDIEVYTENGYLIISGCRDDPTPRDKQYLHQIEIEQGHFSRRIALPPSAETDGVTARLRDGLLRVRIPKRPDAET